MIDIKHLKENPQLYKQTCIDKNRDVDIDFVIELIDSNQKLMLEIDAARHKQKQFNKDDIDSARSNKAKLKLLEDKQGIIEQDLKSVLSKIPNPIKDFVPIGYESHNKIVDTIGKPPTFDFKPKDHTELAELNDLLDTKRPAKTSGARFVAVKNQLALLEMSLFRYIIDKLISKGFEFILPPMMINSFSMQGMGYLDHGGDQETYHLEKDDMYLIGTSEQSIGSMYSDEVFDIKDLPHRVCAFSGCFRREAGSYGKDTKGMFRLHQFYKIEMFSFVTQDSSDEEHQFLLDIEKEIYKELEIPYQVVLIASGDLGDPAAAKYDLEAWFPGQNSYREITSTSNTTDFQARRLNIRYKDKDGKLKYVHMLNGTGSSERPLIAILENNQNEDGSICIPKVLIPLMGSEVINNIQ